jgi:hypothetical protein
MTTRNPRLTACSTVLSLPGEVEIIQRDIEGIVQDVIEFAERPQIHWTLRTMSSLLQHVLELCYRPFLSPRAYAHRGSVIGIDKRMRGDLIVYLKKAQLGGRQPCKVCGVRCSTRPEAIDPVSAAPGVYLNRRASLRWACTR